MTVVGISSSVPGSLLRGHSRTCRVLTEHWFTTCCSWCGVFIVSQRKQLLNKHSDPPVSAPLLDCRWSLKLREQQAQPTGPCWPLQDQHWWCWQQQMGHYRWVSGYCSHAFVQFFNMGVSHLSATAFSKLLSEQGLLVQLHCPATCSPLHSHLQSKM